MMRLQRLFLSGFGVLSLPKRPFEFPEGRINLFVGPNEVGKTTLAEALFAALYGLEHRRSVKHTSLALRDAWRPVRPNAGADAPFGLRLEVEHGSQILAAEWDFEDRVLRVRDARTGADVTERFHVGRNRYELGKQLTGLSDAEFRKVCYIGQDSLSEAGDATGISDLVQRFASSASGDSYTTAQALERLENARHNYPGVTAQGPRLLDNEVRDLQRQRDDVENQLRDLEREHDSAAHLEEAYEGLCDTVEDLERRIRRARHLHAKAELGEIRRRVAQAADAERRLEALRKQKEALAYLEDFPGTEAPKLRELYARLKTERETAERLRHRLHSEIRPRLDDARRRLRTLGPLAEATERDMRLATDLEARLRSAWNRLADLERAIQAEEERLHSEDILPGELAALERELRGLSENALEDAAAYPATREAFQGRLAAAQTEFRLTGEALAGSRRRRTRSKTAAALLLTGVLLGGASGLAALSLPETRQAGYVGVALGTLLAAAGLLLRFTLPRGEVDPDALEQRLHQLDEQRATAQREMREFRQRMERYAAVCGAASVDRLSEAARQYLKIQRRCATFVSLQKQHPEAVAEKARLLEQAEALASRFGEYLDRANAPAWLDAFSRRLAEAAHLQRDVEVLIQQADAEENRLRELEARHERTDAEMRRLLAAAGVSEEDPDKAMAAFETRRASWEEYLRLRDESIPEQACRLTPADEKTALVRRARHLEERIRGDEASDDDLPRDEPTATSTEYAETIENLSADLREARSRKDDAWWRIARSLERYREQRPPLLEKRSQIEAHLRRARRHQRALEIATEELRAVASEVYGKWSVELNERVNALLRRWAPSLRDLRFDEDLVFRVRRAADDAEVAHPDAPHAGVGLSAGQRDQLYLAVRLGVAEFISGTDAALPLILDDPFVHFDDDRFAAAMRFLGERARAGIQIILLTCHRARFEWLRARDPAWFDAHIALLQMPGASPATRPRLTP